MTRIVVTGSNGFIGKALCKRLLELNHEVLGLDISETDMKHRNFKSLQGDISDPKYIDPNYGGTDWWRDVDFCYHLAAMANVDEVREQRDKAFRVNVYGTFNIAEICRTLDIPIIYASTCCFPKGMKVFTEKGVKDISKIKVGDIVLTHKGRFQKVTKVFERDYNGYLIKIKPLGHRVITSTPEHLFFTNNNQWVESKELEKEILTIPRLEKINSKSFVFSTTKNSYSTIHSREKRKNKARYSHKTSIEVNEELMYLIGLYLAEGWVSRGGGSKTKNYVNFAFGDEPLLIEKCQNLIQSIFNQKTHIVKQRNQKGSIVYFGNIHLVKFFEQFYDCDGFRAKNKIIPKWIFGCEKSLLYPLINGYFDGDGCIYQDIRTVSSSSESLIVGVKIIMNELGMYFPMYTQFSKPSQIGGRQIKGGIFFTLKKEFTTGKKSKPLSVSLSKESFNGKVYNLEVENDNSYLIDCFPVHNCCYGNNIGVEDGVTDPLDLYGVTKLVGENLIRGLCKKWVILRFGTTYGSSMRPALATHIFLKSAMENKPFPIKGDGEQTRSWIHIDDLVDGCVRAMTAYPKDNRQIINLAGARTYTIWQMAWFCREVVTGKEEFKIKFDQLPERPEDIHHEDINIGKAWKLLGWKPKIDLKDGLRMIYKEWTKDV